MVAWIRRIAPRISHAPQLAKQLALEERTAGLARLEAAYDLAETASRVVDDFGHELRRRLGFTSGDHRRMSIDFDRMYLSDRVRHR